MTHSPRALKFEKLLSTLDVSPLLGSRVLITGASGLLGGGLAEFFMMVNQVFGRGVELILQSRSLISLRERFDGWHLKKGVTFVETKVLEIASLVSNVDWVLHCSSPASPKDYMADPVATVIANVDVVSECLKKLARREFGSFLLVSSADIYGDPPSDKIPTPEDFLGAVPLTSPRSCYGQSKRLAEALVSSYVAMGKGDGRIVRPFNVYGPGQRICDGRLIADFIYSGIQRRPIGLRSNGKPTRSFCYIVDAVDGIVRVLLWGVPGRPYNIGNDWDERSVEELAKIASEKMGLPPPILEPAPEYEKGSFPRCCPDISRARGELNFSPSYSFERGFEETCQWHRIL